MIAVTVIRTVIKYAQVDAFTRSPFRGKPVVVAVMPGPLADESMATAAQELGLDETVFVTRGADSFSLRSWRAERAGRSGATERSTCETAALAAAHVLWTDGHLGHGEVINFSTQTGKIEVRKRADHIALTVAALRDLRPIVEVPDEDALRSFVATAPALVTAASREVFRDFTVRTFEARPEGGVAEELVSAHAFTTLGPFWLDRLNKENVQGEQLAPRPAVVNIERAATTKQVVLSGQAITVLKGIFIVAP